MYFRDDGSKNCGLVEGVSKTEVMEVEWCVQSQSEGLTGLLVSRGVCMNGDAIL